LVDLLATATVLAGIDKQGLKFVEDFEALFSQAENGSKVLIAMYQDQPISVQSPTRRVAGFETNKGVQLKHTTKLQQTVQEWNDKIPALEDSPQLSENALQQAGPAVKHRLHLSISYCKN